MFIGDAGLGIPSKAAILLYKKGFHTFSNRVWMTFNGVIYN